jgi:alpha-L-fucosidase
MQVIVTFERLVPKKIWVILLFRKPETSFMKRSFLILSLIISTHNSFGQVVADSSLLLSEKDMQWWKDAKLGLFIHFGLYSVLGQGEWAMFNKQMDTSEYGQLKDSFTVSKFSGKNWVAIAKQAGCRYMVVTSRHHDGFSLFNTGSI